MNNKVALICMPFASALRPSLGISLLKAQLTAMDTPVDIHYFNILLAELLGKERYGALCGDATAGDDQKSSEHSIPNACMAGEWLFSQHYYDRSTAENEAYLGRVCREADFDNDEVTILRETIDLIPSFLKQCVDSVDWDAYWLVGFTSTFQQNMASLSLAKRLKELRPQLEIIFGGANCEDAMGLQLLREYPFIDYVAIGEADQSFPELVRRRLRGRSVEGVAGIATRPDMGPTSYVGAELVRDLDALPYPDFGEFFKRFKNSSISYDDYAVLPLETSRGCWWGERKHCTFCGLNGTTMSYRAKGALRAYEEIDYLTSLHQAEHVELVDNILDMKYFRTLLPLLQKDGKKRKLFFETKSNLNRRHVEMLARSGVRWIQPGIESLSTNILKLMRKGVTGIQNVALLKWCRQMNIKPMWNLLYGFPGENPDEYDHILEILVRIAHLEPGTAGPVGVHRFSPYFDKPDEFALNNVRPAWAYQYIYPFPPEVLAQLAYFFEFGPRTSVEPPEYARRVIDFCLEWSQLGDRGQLVHQRQPEGQGLVTDTRPNRVIDHATFDRVQNSIYEFCDGPKTISRICRYLQDELSTTGVNERAVVDFLEYLVEVYLMIRENDSFLSVALIDSNASTSATPVILRGT